MALTDNLTAYWKLDEASGSRSDSLGVSTLTDVNGVLSASGKVGVGASFVASSAQALSCADNVPLSTGDIDFTFACWIYAYTLTGYPCVASKGWQSGTNPNREWILYVDSAVNKLVFGVEGSAEGGVTSSVVLSVNTWYFVAVWHSATSNRLVIQVDNGTPDLVTHNTGVHDGTGAFRLGSSDPSHFIYWDGLIDEVGFWKKVLSDAERTELWYDGIGLTYPFTPPSFTYYKYGTSTPMVVTLANLADQAAWASAAVDNSDNKFVDALVQIRYQVVPGTVTGSGVRIHLYHSEDGVNFPDEIPGATGGAYTFRSKSNVINIRTVYATAGLICENTPISIAGLLNGRLPRFWGVVLFNASGLALTATESDHSVRYTGVYL